MSCLLEKGENKNEIWVKKPYVAMTYIRPVEKSKKKLDLRKYKKNMSCLLEKGENTNENRDTTSSDLGKKNDIFGSSHFIHLKRMTKTEIPQK